jgi:hypothetical protein
MANPRLTDEVLRETVAAVRQHGGIAQAARAIDVPFTTVWRRYHQAAARGFLGFDPVLPGFQIKQTSIQRDAKGNKQKEWIQQKPEPGAAFELPHGHIVKGVSALVDKDERVTAKWIKTRVDAVTPDLVEALKTAFADYSGKAPLIEAPIATEERLLSVYPIADQHHGMLAWGRETGADYDLKIGSERLRSCMQRLVAQSPSSKQAIIINLGDWNHTDDQRNVTPQNKHGLDVDSRYYKILTSGVQLMMDCVELAAQRHENVLVRNIPGNHDPHASIALTVALSAFYANNPRISVDLDPSDYFFHRHGVTLLGATHGHKMRPDRMAMAMAVRCREDWGRTKFHWFLFGHIHHETVREVGDVRVESFQSLASNDAHSAGAGYVAGHSLVSVTLDAEHGEVGRHRVNIAPLYRPTQYLKSVAETGGGKAKRRGKTPAKRKRGRP